MKLAIMQPYIFPYIGYFQLINAVDKFVIYDDVTFIKQGWINRNRILLNGGDHMFNIILKRASSFSKINEIETNCNNLKLLKTLEQAYRKAPFFNEAYALLTEILTFKEPNLAKFLTNSLQRTCLYLGISTHFLVSSEIQKDQSLKGEERVINISKILEASEYFNAFGGQNLYSPKKFAQNGLVLCFIRTKPIVYPQFKNNFVAGLSIIDVMMFNSKEVIEQFLNQYELI